VTVPQTTFQSKWRPAPDPAPQPAPEARVEAAPPTDAAAEERRAAAARRAEEDRQRRTREREFAGLTSNEQRRVVLAGDALTGKGLDGLTNAELAVIGLYPRQFPAVSPADLAKALAAYGDRKGALDHLTNLGVTDPDKALRVRAAFGMASQGTCDSARAASEEISRVGLAGLSDRARSFVARHPDLFPLPPAKTPSPSRAP
jgi:hypothetical protein